MKPAKSKRAKSSRLFNRKKYLKNCNSPKNRTTASFRLKSSKYGKKYAPLETKTGFYEPDDFSVFNPSEKLINLCDFIETSKFKYLDPETKSIFMQIFNYAQKLENEIELHKKEITRLKKLNQAIYMAQKKKSDMLNRLVETNRNLTMKFQCNSEFEKLAHARSWDKKKKFKRKKSFFKKKEYPFPNVVKVTEASRSSKKNSKLEQEISFTSKSSRSRAENKPDNNGFFLNTIKPKIRKKVNFAKKGSTQKLRGARTRYLSSIQSFVGLAVKRKNIMKKTNKSARESIPQDEFENSKRVKKYAVLFMRDNLSNFIKGNREETKQLMSSSTALSFLDSMLRSVEILYSKISHISLKNAEELFYVIKALKVELFKSVDFVYDLVELNKYTGYLLNESNRFCLSETFGFILANYVDFDYVRVMILDKNTGAFYDMRMVDSLQDRMNYTKERKEFFKMKENIFVKDKNSHDYNPEIVTVFKKNIKSYGVMPMKVHDKLDKEKDVIIGHVVIGSDNNTIEKPEKKNATLIKLLLKKFSDIVNKDNSQHDLVGRMKSVKKNSKRMMMMSQTNPNSKQGIIESFFKMMKSLTPSISIAVVEYKKITKYDSQTKKEELIRHCNEHPGEEKIVIMGGIVEECIVKREAIFLVNGMDHPNFNYNIDINTSSNLITIPLVFMDQFTLGALQVSGDFKIFNIFINKVLKDEIAFLAEILSCNLARHHLCQEEGENEIRDNLKNILFNAFN